MRRGVLIRVLTQRFACLAGATIALCVVHAQMAPPAPSTTQAISAPAQSSATDMPAPGAIYKQATHPLDVVRGSLENWSDAELGALAVGIHKAREACTQMKPEDYSGDDLFELARLCAFGQDWNDANSAATRYMDSRADPHRAQAFALSINALVHLNGVSLALESARLMLSSMPYDAEVAYAVRYLKDDLEQSGNGAALSLAADEHQAIVQALRQGVALKGAYGDAVMSYGLLYDSAMQLAFFERFTGQDEAATAIAADCDGALPNTAQLNADDRQRIESVQLQFRLLGTKLPRLAVTRSLVSVNAKAQLPPGFGAGTVLMIFPDWCAQCRTMMKTLTEFAKVNASTPLHAYGLMFHEQSETVGPVQHEDPLKQLQGTPTLLVPAATAQSLGLLDFPTAVVVDGTGVIQFIGLLPTDAFQGDGYVEKVIQRMVTVGSHRPGGPKTSREETRIASRLALDLP